MNDLSQSILILIYVASLAGAVAAIVHRSAGRQKGGQPPAFPSGKVRVWFYRRGDLVCALMLYLLFTGLFALTLFSPPTDMSKLSAAALLFGIGFQLMVTLGVIAFALRLTNANQWLGLRWKQWPWVFLIAPGVVLVMWMFLFGIHQAGYMAWMESLGAETKQETVVLLETSRDPLILVIMVITAVVIAPLWEEIVFRGYLHPVIKKFGGIWAGALCSSLLFAAVHNSLAAMLPLFLLALLMVWLYERTGSIWTPIAIHACFNAAAVGGTFVVRYFEPAPAFLQCWPIWPIR